MDNNTQQYSSDDISDLKDISPGMLSSPQIEKYFKHDLLVKDPDYNLLKGATYDMRLGSPAYRFEAGEKSVINLGEEEDTVKNVLKRLTLPPNSLTFVTTREEFRLTQDVIARFNLKSKWVHKGLLLGTGPIVDPEFEGFLYIPIHNFSSKSVDIDFNSSLIVVEFTKTLDTSSNYKSNPSKKGKIDNYLNSAGDVESSVLSSLKKANDAAEKLKNISIFGIIGFTFGLVTFFISLHDFYIGINSRIENILYFNTQRIRDYESKIADYEKKVSDLDIMLNTLREEVNKKNRMPVPLSSSQKTTKTPVADKLLFSSEPSHED